MLVAVDIETKDPNLKDFGSGAIRKDGKILGVGIYSEETSKYNGYWAPDSQIVRDVMSDASITKIFHNGVYDLDWLFNGYNIPFDGRIEDTMTREQLIDAYADAYSLNACCYRRNVTGKNYDDTIDKWWFEKGKKGKAIEHLDEIPYGIVKMYNEQDLKATWDLYHQQTPLLDAEDLNFTNDIECRLYPLLMNMKKNGIRIDAVKQRKVSDELYTEYNMRMQALQEKYPFLTSLNAPSQLKQLFIAERIPFQYAEKTGAISFAEDKLKATEHPVALEIVALRHLNAAITRFIDGAFMDNKIAGRIHATFYPAKRDEGGTVTGRFSARDPNLQQVSAREDKFGEQVRSIFIPEDDCALISLDYSQIEYRLFLNYAVGDGASEAQQRFINDPSTDYHAMTIELMHWEDMLNSRHLAKNFNFGSIYGLGVKSFSVKFRENLLPLAEKMGMDVLELAGVLQNQYFTRIPFVKSTMRAIQNKGISRGYIRTLSGRRQRMPLDNKAYKLVNYLCQGSAADICKKGLVDAWDKGVFSTLKMHATIHDENLVSMPLTKEGKEAVNELIECMENAYKIKIPILVSRKAGDDWGHCSKDYYKEIMDDL